MGRPRRQRPMRPVSEAEEKREIARQQIRDASCGGMVLLWLFERRHFMWVDVAEGHVLGLAAPLFVGRGVAICPQRQGMDDDGAISQLNDISIAVLPD